MKGITCNPTVPFIIAAVTALFLTVPGVKAENYGRVDYRGVIHLSDGPGTGTGTNGQPEEGKRDSRRGRKLFDFRERVKRILGIDAVELESGKVVKYIGVQDPADFANETGRRQALSDAYRFHDELVSGKIVTVLLGKRKMDEMGRYLGHVFIGRDVFVNAELIRKGYALTEELPSDFEYQSLFVRLLREAMRKKAGIWNLQRPATAPETRP